MYKVDVATYNIWCPRYPCNPRIVHTNDRYAKIAKLLKDVHIIAFQEITQEAFDEMKNLLNKHWCAFVEHPNRPDGVAIFMNRNEFDKVRVTNIDIPNGDNKSGLLMEAVHKTTQKTIAVATGHFKGGPYPDRAKGDAECQVVGDIINEVDANLKIFAGDFNEVINLYADQNRITKFINAHQFETNAVDQPPYDTEPANRRTIDHILSKAQGAPGSVTVASKNPNIPATFAGLSDHLPLIKEFTFNPQRAAQPQVAVQQPAQQVFQPQPQPINPVGQLPEQYSFLTNFACSVRLFFSKQFSFLEQIFTNLFTICRKFLWCR